MAVDDYEELLKYYEIHETIGTGMVHNISDRCRKYTDLRPMYEFQSRTI